MKIYMVILQDIFRGDGVVVEGVWLENIWWCQQTFEDVSIFLIKVFLVSEIF